MSPVRMGVLLSVALVASIGAVLITHNIASSHERPAPVVAAPAAPPPVPMVRVLTAAHDLAPGDKITAGDITFQPWPQQNLNPSFITDGAANGPAASRATAAVKIETAAMNLTTNKVRDVMATNQNGVSAKMIDAIVREKILAGEPIVEEKVVHAGAGGVLAVTLDPGMRAMAVPLSAESAAGGFILPGDHVDVVQSRQLDGVNGAKKFVTGSVLNNVKVLAIDQNTRAQKTASVLGATATLEVTPAQAELLALSKSQGELTLILRSYADTAGGATAGGGARAQDVSNVAPTVVKVFRNGAPADVAVAR